MDSLDYVIESIDRITASDYIPTPEDLILNRIQTTGMTDMRMDYGGVKLRLMDMGGRRSERRKWLHSPDENADIVVFIVAISEYNQTIFETPDMNCISESLSYFQMVLNHRIFRRIPLILFFNKMDLFEKKIFEVPLHVVDETGEDTRNEDFEGPYAEDAPSINEKETAINAAKTYMARKFLDLCETERVLLHCFVTATEIQSVRAAIHRVAEPPRQRQYPIENFI
uniref:Uncharacterized protein n=1 Tax=Aplanochytrium stocchinoi TaxID=215587 RepID=A0A7S3LMQ3_9STRA|eukprot:CAMPEP_0204872668 /NCGR_PEP_ID=MMETSP1348-20121228/38499_1 /ASSEMBLY_ACC=CAM_ASM_000700 /TAXON_ID=215587 /ORGANISM="Aplanochytrium stocchinoi, Strain GSBS06" /LENGTH=225 /DNA_ID=CAMNT_0052027581 /DNA_START=226 /DNA_END=903 /DNA_ORIENTATION=-